MPRNVRWLLLALAVAGVFPFMQKGTSELPVYLLGAERFLHGLELYQPSDAKPFTYPPLFALPFVPLTLVPGGPGSWAHGEWLGLTWDLRRAVWWFANLAMLGWILRSLLRWTEGWYGAADRRGRAWFWGLVLALAGRHVWSVLSNQSHDLVILWLLVMAIDFWRRQREVDTGSAVAMAAACKATPLLFIGPLFLSGNWRSWVACGVGLVGFLLLPDALVPRQDGSLHVIAWYQTFLTGISAGGAAAAEGAWNAHSNLNQSLSGTLHRLLTPVVSNPPARIFDVHLLALDGTAKKAVTMLAQLAVLGVIALVAWRRGRSRDRDLLAWRRTGIAAMTVCGMVLLSPMSSKSHFCVLLLPAAFAAEAWLRSRDRVLGALLILWFVSGTLLTKGVLGWKTAAGVRAGDVVLSYGPVTWAAALALFTVGHAVFYGLGSPVAAEHRGPAQAGATPVLVR